MEWRYSAKKPASCTDTAQSGKPRYYNICYVRFCHLLCTHGSMAIQGILFLTTRTLHQILGPECSGCFPGTAARYLQLQDNKRMGQCKELQTVLGQAIGMPGVSLSLVDDSTSACPRRGVGWSCEAPGCGSVGHPWGISILSGILS